MKELQAAKTGGTAQAVLPIAPPDTRLLCWRYPIGWEKWEVRLEAHQTTDPATFGRVFISDEEGNRVELDWHTLRDMADNLQGAVDTLWDDREAARKAKANGADG